MPQPFKGDWTATTNAVGRRPNLAPLFGVIVSMWSQVELHLGYVLALMLRTNSMSGVSMYVAIRAEPARLAAMNAAAECCLEPEQLERFSKLSDRISKIGKQRDLIAHGIWATPNDGRDSLVWLDARAVAKHFSVVNPWMMWEDAGKKRMPTTLEAYLGSAMEYREEDFVDIIERIGQLLKDLDDFQVELSQEAPVIKQIIAARSGKPPDTDQ